MNTVSVAHKSLQDVGLAVDKEKLHKEVSEISKSWIKFGVGFSKVFKGFRCLFLIDFQGVKHQTALYIEMLLLFPVYSKGLVTHYTKLQKC